LIHRLAVVAASLALLAGCDLTVNPDARPLSGEWIGTYTCSQGLTGLTLTLTGHASGAVDAIFSFYAVPENPGVPSGSSHKRGVYQIGGGLNLAPFEWIDQPPGYVMTELDGHVSPDLTTYSGTFVDRPTCTTFHVTRQ
jgi:hypothetical protein